MSKNQDYRRMIQSKQWKMLRKKKIEANPVCEDCFERDVIEVATEVHHIVPVETALDIRRMESLMFDYDNLRSLCPECHVNAHIHLGSKRKESVQENNHRVSERFKKRFLD